MKKAKIIYKKASNDDHLWQILALQKLNLPSNIDNETYKTQGFVTAVHDFELLKKMNLNQAHVIALDDEKVIGYALSMTTDFAEELPVLESMFKTILSCEYKNLPMKDYKYFTMGQVCIAYEYRSTGVFGGLYHHMKKLYGQFYDCLLTEIDQRNTRSIAAHKKVGFKLLHRYSVHSEKNQSDMTWDLVLWDWQ